MATSADNWCLIESDPGVFTELIRGFGVDGVQVEELWSLSPEDYEPLKPIHGLIFLFKWLPGHDEGGVVVPDNGLTDIFFAKQVINNACATQAILSVLLNCNHSDVKLGKTLSDFKEFTASFDASMKGLTLSNSDTVRQVHNSFAKQQMFELDQKLAQKDEDVYHFIAYVPINGRLYELDGLKNGPIDRGEIPADQNWVKFAKPVIETRINKYAEGEIHFNLMAIISDKKKAYEKQLVELTKNIENSSMETDTAQVEIDYLKRLIEDEENKMKRYRVENIRRKHNYLPLIMEVLKTLAESGELVKLVEKEKERKKNLKKASSIESKK